MQTDQKHSQLIIYFKISANFNAKMTADAIRNNFQKLNLITDTITNNYKLQLLIQNTQLTLNAQSYVFMLKNLYL